MQVHGGGRIFEENFLVLSARFVQTRSFGMPGVMAGKKLSNVAGRRDDKRHAPKPSSYLRD